MSTTRKSSLENEKFALPVQNSAPLLVTPPAPARPDATDLKSNMADCAEDAAGEDWIDQYLHKQAPLSITPALSTDAHDGHWLPIFDVAEVTESLLNVDLEEKPGQLSPLRPVLESAQRMEGRREIPTFNCAEVMLQLNKLRKEMPNFSPAVDILLAEFGFAITAPISEFRIEPLLLAGPPGLGKTRFVSRLASVLKIPFEKISIAVTQSSGDIAGSSRFWSNTRPGRLAQLMADSMVGCPIVLLDEIDKINSAEHYPVSPVLLDLLEQDSAKQFRDESLQIRFNMSHVIVLATANDLSLVDAPLRSRFRVVQIIAPDAEQKKVIIHGLLKELIGKRSLKVEKGAVDKLAEVDVDLRELRRQLRHAIGSALLSGNSVLRRENFPLQLSQRQRSIGFL